MEPVVAVGTFAVIKYAALYKLSKQAKKLKQKVGKLSQITVFPVKSMRGIDVEEAGCTFEGLVAGDVADRAFMVVDYKQTFFSARKEPKMSTIVATLESNKLVMKAPGAEAITVDIPSRESAKIMPVSVWDEPLEGLDCGDSVGAWLEKTLGRAGLRLVYSAHGLVKRRCLDGPTSWHKLTKQQDKVSYQDGFPFMLMSTASVAELNTRLKEPVKMSNFRPNFVVEGCDAYDETKWDRLYIGDAEFTNNSHCSRCIMTTVDPATGVKEPNMEPLRTLKSYRMLEPELEAPCFGVNLVLERPGHVRAGDTVYATLK